tara:strand:+ start:360 stop:578 length:219 start_codon:yes stop_codon:yes gene_type:complete
MSDNSIIAFSQLQQVTGLIQKKAIKRHLTENGIRFFETNSSIYTTVELMNAAGGLVLNLDTVKERKEFIIDA